jgi:serine phosphatase RsbU (regulator of sigma subunit)
MTKGLKDKRLIEQFSQALSFHFELDKIRQLTIDYLVHAIGAKGGLFYCFDGETKICTLQAVCGEVSANPPRTFSITDSLSQTCLEYRVCYATDPESGIQDMDLGRFGDLTIDPEVKLTLSVVSKETLLALIFLYDKATGEPYTKKDEHFLKTLSEQASLALENATLLEELTEQERLKRELEIARQVQVRLLPGEMPVMDGMDISGICQPATEVGGDYYDFFPLDDHRLGIAIADVSGKGTSAAFYMAEIKGMMSSLTLQMESPRNVLCALNERLYQSVDRQVFATMIYAMIDLEKQLLTFVRAGHNGLLVKRSASNQVLLHIPSGIGLGLTDSQLFDLHLEEESIRLNPDDTIVFYTDGVSEAMDGLQKEYGEDALIDLVQNTRVNRAVELQDLILQDLNRFVGDRKQHDDITMVIAHLNDTVESTLREHRAKQKQPIEELTGQPLG